MPPVRFLACLLNVITENRNHNCLQIRSVASGVDCCYYLTALAAWPVWCLLFNFFFFFFYILRLTVEGGGRGVNVTENRKWSWNTFDMFSYKFAVFWTQCSWTFVIRAFFFATARNVCYHDSWWNCWTCRPLFRLLCLTLMHLHFWIT